MTSPGTSWNLQEVDNTPDMDAAVDLEDNVGGEIRPLLQRWVVKIVPLGEGVELEELPQNLIELRVISWNWFCSISL